MQIKNLFPGGFAANCYLVTKGSDAVLVDCTAPKRVILDALQKEGAALRAILLTHGHFDHMLTVAEVKAETGAAVYLAKGDEDLPCDGEKNAFALFFGYDKAYPAADVLVMSGDELVFGELSIKVLATPGHTRGSVTYLLDDVAFTGDTLFESGYGRYDLYGGDPHALRESLRKLATLPHQTVIYPGHGDTATLGAALAALGRQA